MRPSFLPWLPRFLALPRPLFAPRPALLPLRPASAWTQNASVRTAAATHIRIFFITSLLLPRSIHCCTLFSSEGRGSLAQLIPHYLVCGAQEVVTGGFENLAWNWSSVRSNLPGPLPESTTTYVRMRKAKPARRSVEGLHQLHLAGRYTLSA